MTTPNPATIAHRKWAAEQQTARAEIDAERAAKHELLRKAQQQRDDQALRTSGLNPARLPQAGVVRRRKDDGKAARDFEEARRAAVRHTLATGEPLADEYRTSPSSWSF